MSVRCGACVGPMVLVIAGCGRVDEEAPAADASPHETIELADLATTCRSFFTSYCSAWHACIPDSFEELYGDEPTCLEEKMAFCLSADLPGVTDWLGFMRCSETFTHTPRFVCRGFRRSFFEDVGCDLPRGTLPIGSDCTYTWQCASGECPVVAAGCAKCGEPAVSAALGTSCAKGELCPSGTRCERTDTDYLCFAVVEEGAPCLGKACHVLQQCKLGRCVALGEFGDPCETSSDCVFAAWCDPSKLACVPVPSAAEGEECGRSRTDLPPTLYCKHGFTCEDDAAGRFTCQRTRGVGESCSTAGLPESFCARSLTCVDGLCGRPEPRICP